MNSIIKDLTGSSSYPFSSITEAVEIIKTLYYDADVVFGEFIATIAINDCNLDDVITITARARKEIDGDDMYIIDLDSVDEVFEKVIHDFINIIGRHV